jgi:hypothetical protein
MQYRSGMNCGSSMEDFNAILEPIRMMRLRDCQKKAVSRQELRQATSGWFEATRARCGMVGYRSPAKRADA